MPRYLIGIDLGTTNSALAYIDLDRDRPGPSGGGRSAPAVETFAVPQLVGPGEIRACPLLPSFLYLPGPHDLPAGATTLPWNDPTAKPTGPETIVGEFARSQGAKVPGRLVNSAKSWLCHSAVDRTAPLLPWTAPPDVPRLSPLEVSTRYLAHFVAAWNYTHPKPSERLQDQPVTLTVPASFDDVARSLTVEAAKQAGLTRLTLLEEPQAAFYCWLAMHAGPESGQLRPGMHCLVVDVGGGTTDFSLIEVAEDRGEPTFRREAVGEHLLLGGDNMDMTLARQVESRLGGRVDPIQFAALVQACRQAKEQLLATDGPKSVTVSVQGRGGRVVGGSLSATITADEVRTVLFDGFFPLCPRDREPDRHTGGLHEMGLPYVADPAISHHLAAFLRRHLGERPPEALIFNGGVFQPALLRQRVVEVLQGWFGSDYTPLVLTNPSLDLAVAWGAAYAGWLRHTGGRRIGGGLARSYYVGVAAEPAAGRGESSSASAAAAEQAATATEAAATATEQAVTVLCVVPRHLEEGQEITLTQPQLQLALGEPVLFPLYCSTIRPDDQPGQVLRLPPGKLLELPPLHTILRGGKRAGVKQVPVTLAARCTEIGTLELHCVASDGGNRWKLEFNVRDTSTATGAGTSTSTNTGAGSGTSTGTSTGSTASPDAPDTPDTPDAAAAGGMVATVREVLSEDLVQAASAAIRGAFPASGPSNPPPQELIKALETALDLPRNDWPTGLCRRLWEALVEVADQRHRSAAHLARWYNLAGFCLRPGFGDPLDRYRVEQLWKKLNAPTAGGAAPAGPVEGGADAWILWRRVAGGLNTALQVQLFNRLRGPLLGKGGAKPPVNELAEMWRCAASLERLDAKTKAQLGEVLLKQAVKSPVAPHVFWSLTRLGARSLLYGPLNTVLHRDTAHDWLDALLPFDPANDNERLAWAFALASIARKTGQRALDIDESRRKSVKTVLKTANAPDEWLQMVESVVDLTGSARSRLFGETLPIGLRLTHAAG
jgi:molecular chaperone DnaK (HSP70)